MKFKKLRAGGTEKGGYSCLMNPEQSEQHGLQGAKDAQGAEGVGQAEAGALQQQASAATGGASVSKATTSADAGQKEVIVGRIRAVEAEMARWRRRCSQSNPGDVWDYREMQRELEYWQAVYRCTEGQ